jgi:death-on-curing protein
MRYLTTSEILELHRLVIERTGGSLGVRDMNLLESAVAQPAMAFGGEELYCTLSDKGAALAFSVIMNHPLSMVTSEPVMLLWKRFQY